MAAAHALNPECPDAALADDILDDPCVQAHSTRWIDDPRQGRVAVTALQISGMFCAACAGTIERAAMAVPGVLAAQVSSAAQRASVRWQGDVTALSAVVAAIRQAGYDAVPDAAAPARALRQREHRAALWRLFVAAFCAMQVMTFAVPVYLADMGRVGDLTPDLRALLNWGSWLLSLPVVVFAAGPFFSGAWRSLRSRRIGMDVPVALGVAVTFVASSGAAFDPAGAFGSEVYFDSLTMFVTFLLGGRLLEMRARHRAAEALEDAVGNLPETALRRGPDGRFEPVSVQRLRAGDVLRVPVGQAFAADGLLIEGHTQADERLLTGESAPVHKPPGAEVVAGSLNVSAPVTMRVLRAGPDTRQAAILDLVRDAATQRPASTAAADRWAGPFLWAVLVLALGGAAVWSFIDPARAVWVAVSVLIVTCPCALSLAAPSALLAATAALARRGVIVRRLDMLDALARVDLVFLDKTGTLTTDTPRLVSVQPAQPMAPGELARLEALAVELAGWSSHPLSRALCAERRPERPPDRPPVPAVSARCGQVTEVPGHGVSGVDSEGQTWRLGAPAWICEGMDADPEDAERRDEPGLAFGRPGAVALRFVFDETLRPDAVAAVQALQQGGVEVRLLSGDAPARVQALAARVGVSGWQAAATPQDKLDAVRTARAAGHCVAMVGDGLNDAPVLASADVSFAMGHGALVARAQADAVIASGLLDEVGHARLLSRRCMRTVRQNMRWAAGYNAVCIPLALAGWLPPWAAGLGMAASSLFVVGNAIRLGAGMRATAPSNP